MRRAYRQDSDVLASCRNSVMIKTICGFIARWMGMLILLTAALSLLVPEVLMPVDMWVVSPMLGVIMFGMGLTLRPADFRVVFQRPKDVVVGCMAQLMVMPFLAWLLVRAFSLPDELALGVILVGCCPGGTASNVITFLARGDLALSVGMTAVSTLLAPLLTPLLVWWMAGTMVNVDAAGMFLSILYVVIAPIVVGFAVQWLFPRFTQRAVVFLPAFSTLMIAAVVALIVSHTADRLLLGGPLVVLVVMLHNVLGLAFGYAVGFFLGLSSPKRIAISIEVGMQNSGLASSLATLHFAAYPLATIPGVVFSVWHNISGAFVARVYARKK